jgi:hypothetical protein
MLREKGWNITPIDLSKADEKKITFKQKSFCAKLVVNLIF